jgi:hypothetical protein
MPRDLVGFLIASYVMQNVAGRHRDEVDIALTELEDIIHQNGEESAILRSFEALDRDEFLSLPIEVHFWFLEWIISTLYLREQPAGNLRASSLENWHRLQSNIADLYFTFGDNALRYVVIAALLSLDDLAWQGELGAIFDSPIRGIWTRLTEGKATSERGRFLPIELIDSLIDIGGRVAWAVLRILVHEERQTNTTYVRDRIIERMQRFGSGDEYEHLAHVLTDTH